MRHTRKEFLQLSSAALGGLLLSSKSCEGNNRPDRFGIQMYSVKDVFEKNPKEALRLIASFGYKQVESYERNEDMFWGLTNKGFKKYMDELGMTLISSHCEIEKNFEVKAGQAAEIGMSYLIFNWPYAQQTLEEYKKRADQFNKCGEICKRAGIKFAYHNYESSFKLVDGIYPHDLLMERTDPALVDHQMDIYWLANAGQDPEFWIRKYPNRFRLCHIKDRIVDTNGKPRTCDLGKGTIDFRRVLKTAKGNGMQYYIAEQEDFVATTSVESAKANAAYLKNLKF